MGKVIKLAKYLRGVIFTLMLLIPSLTYAQTQEQSFIGVFQFVATTIDVVGLEDDVSYNIRNELRKSPSLTLINQRELELALSRNDIEQKFSASEAVKAATILNLNYIVIGEVTRDGQQIVANVEVVSPASSKSIGSLKFTFNNQAQIALQANYMGESIIEIIDNHQLDLQNNSANADLDWVDNIAADYRGGLVSILWTLKNPEAEYLGFNIYRANNENGPFSYVASEVEQEAKDNPGNNAGTYYYQLSMINGDGDEIRSQQLVSVVVAAQVSSSLEPPTVVNVTERVNGISLSFFPSADNRNKGILGYELVRRAAGEDWQVVDVYEVEQVNSSKQKNSSSQNSLEKLTLSQPESMKTNGPVYYGVRAYTATEKGQISEAIAYTAASAPTLQVLSADRQREVVFGWAPASAGFGYRIYKRNTQSDDWKMLTEIKGIDQVSYTDTDFSDEDQTFEYAISVFDDYGETQTSPVVTATSKTVLSPPKEVKGISGLSKRAQISWQLNPDPDVVGYSIFRGPYSEEEELTLKRIGEVRDPMATTYIDESVLLDGTQYYYSVAAINKFDRSGPVSKAVLVTTKTPPKPLEALQANLLEGNVELSWVVPQDINIKDIQYVYIERSFDGQNFVNIAQVSAAQTSYIDTSVLAGAKQSYRAIISDKDGLKSKPSSITEVDVTVPLVLQLEQDNGLRKIAFSWVNASVPASIKIYRGISENSLELLAELSEYTESRYVDEQELVDDQQYFIKIEAWLSGVKLAESNMISATTKGIEAPKNLSAQSGLAGKIVLAWDPVEDSSIAKYVLFRRSLSQQDSELVSIAVIDDPSVSSYTDMKFDKIPPAQQSGESIADGLQYEYAIASKNIFDATGYIGDTVIAASKQPPKTVADVEVSVNADDIELTWSMLDETDLQYIIIERKWPFESDFSELAKLDANVKAFNDSEIYPYISPEYKISLTDTDNLRSTDYLVNNINNPNKTNLQVSKDGMLRQVQLTWDTSNPNVEMTLERRTVGGDFRAVTTVASEVKSYSDANGLLDETVYEYQLTAQTNGLNPIILGKSNIVSAKTKALPMPPSLRAQSGGVKSVVLTWDLIDDPDVAGYHLYKVDANDKLDKLKTLDTKQTAFTDEGSFFSKLSDGTQYQYKIASFNSYNVEGPLSDVVAAQTKALPGIPMGVSTELNASSPNVSVVVSWEQNSEDDIVHYEVHRGSSCARVRALVKVMANEASSYTDTDLSDGRSYCYKVKAVDASELESALSLGAEITLAEVAQ